MSDDEEYRLQAAQKKTAADAFPSFPFIYFIFQFFFCLYLLLPFSSKIKCHLFFTCSPTSKLVGLYCSFTDILLSNKQEEGVYSRPVSLESLSPHDTTAYCSDKRFNKLAAASIWYSFKK